MSTTDWTPDTPVVGQEGDPDFGTCRVCQYHDPGTGALMYRIEKESTAPADEADLIAVHVSAAYCRRLLVAMKADMGGELGAKGAMLLILGATQASDGEYTPARSSDRPAGHPDPLRPTRYNPEGSPDWSGRSRPEDAITPTERAITPLDDGSDSTGELPF